MQSLVKGLDDAADGCRDVDVEARQLSARRHHDISSSEHTKKTPATGRRCKDLPHFDGCEIVLCLF